MYQYVTIRFCNRQYKRLIVTISSCSYAGEFSPIFGAVAGQVLKFTSTVPNGTITIRSGSSAGPVVGFGTSPLTVSNTFNGTLYAHWNTPGCGSLNSCNSWDALAATWYGYQTLWVNRTGAPFEELGTQPTRTGTSLRDVLSFF